VIKDFRFKFWKKAILCFESGCIVYIEVVDSTILIVESTIGKTGSVPIVDGPAITVDATYILTADTHHINKNA
jgi:hypothetical protein